MKEQRSFQSSTARDAREVDLSMPMRYRCPSRLPAPAAFDQDREQTPASHFAPLLFPSPFSSAILVHGRALKSPQTCRKETETTMHFGERLRQERLRRHLSQEALAEALGVSAKSISRWEQEQAVPQASVRLHLSRFFGLPPQDLFGDAESLPPPTRLWGVPFPRDPFFTGREDLLHQIHTALWADPPTVHTSSCALYGLGGMGKTHLALEYAYRHALSYEAVFWISAQSVESILSSFLTIAELLHLPERQEADQQRIIAAVQRWLSTQSRWLLIWDNLEEIDWLPRFQPPAPWGAVLITTQRQALGTLTQGLELLTMTEEEGMLLLLRRAKVLSPQATSEQMQQFAMSQPSEYAAARQVVRVLAGLPLALDQAGAY